MSEWIEHDGKGMPVPAETRVELRFRDGDTRFGAAGTWDSDGDEGTQWRFLASDPDFDIVAYRILSPTPPQDRTQSEDAA